jgi:hypothetical protein
MIILSIAVVLLSAAPATAQNVQGRESLTKKAPTRFDVSRPLREIVPVRPARGPNRLVPEYEPPRGTYNRYIDVPERMAPAAPHVVQSWQGEGLMPTPNTNFEGVGNGISGYTVQVAPPDTQGDVGPNYYVQWVNLDFAVFDKTTGTIVYGPAAGNSIWSGFGGLCETRNDGDPIAKYDQLADRWVMTQFAIDQSNDEYAQCIAISQTDDPMGAWYRYSYSFSDLNDYPKLAVWPDGYYITYNMFRKIGNSYIYVGAMACAYDRAAMLTGSPTPDALCSAPNRNYFSYLPSDLDGFTSPPTGADNYVMALGDDQLLFWTLDVDWTTPGGTFSGPTAMNVAPFTQECVGYSRHACIPQEGTTVKLESLGDRAMFRLPYRNFGDHESLVLSHSIDTGSEISGIRWYEIRDPGGTPTIYQSGTYAPDSHYRWMGSMAMDRVGNMAVGYSVSDSSMNPSIWYTGRLVTDPLNQLPQTEAVIQNGTGSQTTWSQGDLQRWGDYSSMSVDPNDDCTFWYTQEYLVTDGSFNWHTRIASFVFPSCVCTAPAPDNFSAVASDNNAILLDWDDAIGATEYRVYRSMTSGSGFSLLSTVTPPTTTYTDADVHGGLTYYYVVTNYDGALECESVESGEASATATGACELPPSFTGITTAAQSGCTIDLTWSAATPTCSGPVSYSVYRSTTSGFTPSPANRIGTALGTTDYTDSSGLSPGTTYYFIVRATDDSNGKEDTNTVEVSASINASPMWSEDFENGSAGWSGTGLWHAVTSTNCVSPPATSGVNAWYYGQDSSCNYATGGRTTGTLTSPTIANVTSSSELSFSYWRVVELYPGAYDITEVEVSYNGGSSWTRVWYRDSNDASTASWLSSGAIGLSPPVSPSEMLVRFTFDSNDALSNDYTGWLIDDVQVTNLAGEGCPITPSDVAHLTARATSGEVMLEWMNPSGAFASTRICRDDAAYPTDPETCTVVANEPGNPVEYDSYTDSTVSNGTKYYYTAFANNGSDVFSGGRSVSARPFNTAGSVKWAYTTGASALAPSGIISGDRCLMASNDRVLHGISAGTGGGTWPSGWVPAAMNAPAQGRPTVVDFLTPTVPDASGASKVAFVREQGGLRRFAGWACLRFRRRIR